MKMVLDFLKQNKTKQKWKLKDNGEMFSKVWAKIISDLWHYT